MKKIYLIIAMIFMAMLVNAMPAKKGVSRNVLIGGKTLNVQLSGDEFCHFWQTPEGKKVVLSDDGTARFMTVSEMNLLQEQTSRRRDKCNSVRQKRMPRKDSASSFIGKKKGLVILVNFSDKKMNSKSTREEFDDMFNLVGYNNNNHIGSVHDYFFDQSYKKFDLEFDVVGPVNLSRMMSFYGGNDSYGNDKNADVMVVEACRLVDEEVNFADYDWDGDGEVDQVFFIYAGYGENAGGPRASIWPHEWTLEEAETYGGESPITLDDVRINTYAVSCELAGSTGTTINGIGTACHEFSHCLGYPDFYDTVGNSFGMGAWDLLDYGSYSGPNSNGEVPSGYTSYERMVAGWLTPIELNPGDTILSMKSLLDEPEAYILYNDNNHNEYYLLENRQPERWFSYNQHFEGAQDGMLIIHVDYKEDAWISNTVNNSATHQRMSPFRANNSTATYYTSANAYLNNLYPYNNRDSLTNTSTPAAKLFNANTDGNKLMNKPIRDITRNGDGTMSFICGYGKVEDPGDITPPEPLNPVGDVLFYESFDKCNGTGANDDLWKSSIATSAFAADNDGWTFSRAFGANKAARFGTGNIIGLAATPCFRVYGDAELTFKAATWGTDDEELIISVNGTPLESVSMGVNEWKSFSVPFSAEGECTISFCPSQRFFLDEVKVISKAEMTGIEELITTEQSGAVYSLSGQYLGNSMDTLPKGLYLVKGKKILK